LLADFSQINASYAGNQGFFPPSSTITNTADVTGTLDNGFAGGWTDTSAFTVDTGTPYFVNLLTYAQIDSRDAPDSITGTAVVDPTFGVDPSVANASGYCFAFSAGVPGTTCGVSGGGGTPVPEPATLALIAVGILGAVGLRRRS
jgi:hypothetical protein